MLYADRHRRAVAALCRERNLVMASHDDGEEAHVEEAIGLGINISEFPTTLRAAKHAGVKGMTTVMGAPNVVRNGSHTGNVSASLLARDGVLDALSSDTMSRQACCTARSCCTQERASIWPPP